MEICSGAVGKGEVMLEELSWMLEYEVLQAELSWMLVL